MLGLKVIIEIILIIIYSRLTYNFYRKGGYHKGEQDYRWPILQKIITNKIAWHLFNFFFISFYQNFLLLLITLPVWVRSLSAMNQEWDQADTLLLSIAFILLITEWLADQQQWIFQSKKYQLLKEKRGNISRLPIPYRYGFLTTGTLYIDIDMNLCVGLFRWCRHPNFTCEILIWFVVSLFTLKSNQTLNMWIPSFTGSTLLFLLFLGSTKFTEDISITKYPLVSTNHLDDADMLNSTRNTKRLQWLYFHSMLLVLNQRWRL